MHILAHNMSVIITGFIILR